MSDSQTVSIVHLSDIHFSTATDRANSALSKQQQLFAAIHNKCSSQDIVLLISGDIANSGTKPEYDLAEKFLHDLKQYCKGRNFFHIFAPGNHDCDLSDGELREAFLKDTWPTQAAKGDTKYLRTLLRPQTQFREFAKRFGREMTDSSVVSIIDHPHLPLRFNVINTAMVSTIAEEKGALLLPLAEIQKLARDPSRLNITVYHHSESWLDKSIENEFRSSITEVSDLVFTGHDHYDQQFEERNLGGERYRYLFRGAVLQDHEDTETSGFSVLNYTFKTKEASLNTFSWMPHENYFLPEEMRETIRIPELNKNGVYLSTDHRNFLEEPGILISHSRKKHLKLSDFFLFPLLRHRPNDVLERNHQTWITSYQDFMDCFTKNRRVLIYGDDSCGKSALARRLNSCLLQSSAVPVFAKLSDFANASKAHSKNKITELVEHQYTRLPFEKYLQLPKESRVLILDEVSSFDRDRRLDIPQLLDHLSAYFDGIIVFATSDYVVELDVTTPSTIKRDLADYRRYQISDLSKNQRARLISTWINLGTPDDETQSSSRVNLCARIERHVEDRIQTFSIPKKPVFLLTMLQHYERESNYDVNVSSDAHVIDVLIKMNIAAASEQKVRLQNKLAYLEELAFHLYKQDLDFLTIDQVSRFHAEYNQRKGRDIALEDIWADLADSNIVVYAANKTGFKYAYLKYYFIAHYIAKRITDPTIQNEIKGLLEHVELTQNANVISFLSLFTKDKQIVSTLLQKVRQSLAGTTPTSPQKTSAKFIKTVHFERIELAPPNEVNTVESSDHDESDFGAQDQALQHSLNYALRVMRLIGQVLRNSVDNLTAAEQSEIVKEVYQLGLRLTGVLDSAIVDSSMDLYRTLAQHLRKENPRLPVPEVLNATQAEIVSTLFWSLYGVIQRVASSVGHEDMKVIYDQLLNSGSDWELFDLAIRMHYFGRFPEKQLRSTYHAYRENKFIAPIIQQMTIQSLGLHQLQSADGQRICATVELDHQKYLTYKSSR